jgi:hypothetical protein
MELHNVSLVSTTDAIQTSTQFSAEADKRKEYSMYLIPITLSDQGVGALFPLGKASSRFVSETSSLIETNGGVQPRLPATCQPEC